MATYIYETIDETKPIRRFEMKQSMNDKPLTHDPETGLPVRRVITGGYGIMSSGASQDTACGMGACGEAPSHHCCGGGMCHHH